MLVAVLICQNEFWKFKDFSYFPPSWLNEIENIDELNNSLKSKGGCAFRREKIFLTIHIGNYLLRPYKISHYIHKQ